MLDRATSAIETISCRVEGIGRYLDYNRARTAAAAAGARVHIVVPQVKAVTAETAAGIEVTLAETIVWEPVPFEARVAVLARSSAPPFAAARALAVCR